jgi:hypothetical protein
MAPVIQKRRKKDTTSDISTASQLEAYPPLSSLIVETTNGTGNANTIQNRSVISSTEDVPLDMDQLQHILSSLRLSEKGKLFFSKNKLRKLIDDMRKGAPSKRGNRIPKSNK